ncbi:MAG TPA: type VI secretion system contractile sheath large subunit, partial [Polyangiaceae bacterium]|nr:type VI secretion system contractile sheath large subunit [Polyangiaceae bacterium]
EILIVADCSGRRARNVCEPLAQRRVRSLSVDQLESVFPAWNAKVLVQLDSVVVSLEPKTLEDLHPDQLLQNLPLLRELQDSRRDLDSPLAAQRLTTLLGKTASESSAGNTAIEAMLQTTPAQSKLGGADGEPSADTLSRLLGAPPSAVSREGSTPRAAPPQSSVAAAHADVQRLIRGIVGDTGAVRPPSSATTALGEAADFELGRLLRKLLSSPAFRALEATWHGIDGLVRSCPDDELIRYAVVDASAAEIAADASGFAALLRARRPSVVLLDDHVAATAEGIQALLSVLRTCAAQGTILVTGASSEWASVANFAGYEPGDGEVAPPVAARAAWEELSRARTSGAQLALALPRYLLRQPYGKWGEPLDRLAFEEIIAENHEAFAWGNGAYLAARALAVRHAGAGAHLDGGIDLREMPVVRLPDEGGFRLQPSTESWLSERAVERLRAAGFAVLQGIRDTDRIRVHV